MTQIIARKSGNLQASSATEGNGGLDFLQSAETDAEFVHRLELAYGVVVPLTKPDKISNLQPHGTFRIFAERYLENGYAVVPASPFSKMPAQPARFGGGIVTRENLQRDIDWRIDHDLDPVGGIPDGVWIGGPRLHGLKDWRNIRHADLILGGRHHADFCRWGAGAARPGGRFLGIGLVTSRDVIAVDVDSRDPEVVAKAREYLDTIPGPVIERVGSKGFARFYRVEGAGVDSQRLGTIDVLANGDFCVLPGSFHPGANRDYEWTGNATLLEIAAAELPVITREQIEAAAEIAAPGALAAKKDAAANRAARKARRKSGDESGYISFADRVSDEALNNPAWVFKLAGVARPAWAGTGVEAVNVMRAGGTGKPLERRKQNLRISGHGIKDFGSNETWSPVGLVEASEGLNFPAAVRWLANELGYSPDEIDGALREEARRRAKDEQDAKIAATMAESLFTPPIRIKLPSGYVDIIDVAREALIYFLPGPKVPELEPANDSDPAPIIIRHPGIVALYDGTGKHSIDEAGRQNDESMRWFAQEGIAAHRDWIDTVESVVFQAQELCDQYKVTGRAVHAAVAEDLDAQRDVSRCRKALAEQEAVERETQSAGDYLRLHELRHDLYLAEARYEMGGTSGAVEAAKQHRDEIKAQHADLLQRYEALGSVRPIYLLPAFAGTGKTRALGQVLLAETSLRVFYGAPTTKLVREVESNNVGKITGRYGQTAEIDGKPVCDRSAEAKAIVGAGGNPALLCTGCPLAKTCEYQARKTAAESGHVGFAHALLTSPMPAELGGETKEGVFAPQPDALVIDEGTTESLAHDIVWMKLDSLATEAPRPVKIEGDDVVDNEERVEAGAEGREVYRQIMTLLMDAIETAPAQWKTFNRSHVELSGLSMRAVRDAVDVNKLVEARDRLLSRLDSYHAAAREIGLHMAGDFHAAGELKRRIERWQAIADLLKTLIDNYFDPRPFCGYVMLRRGDDGVLHIAANPVPKPHESWKRWDMDNGAMGYRPPALLLLDATSMPDEVLKEQYALKMPAFPMLDGKKRAIVSKGYIHRLPVLEPRRAASVAVFDYLAAPTRTSQLGLQFGADVEDTGAGSRNRGKVWSVIAALARKHQVGKVVVVGSKLALEWVECEAKSAGLDCIVTMGWRHAVGLNEHENADAIVILSDGRSPPLEESMKVARLNGGWWGEGSPVDDDMILKSDQRGRVYQAAERIRTSRDKGKPQEVHNMAGLSSMLPDAVLNFHAAVQEVRVAELLERGLTKNMGAMRAIYGADCPTEWEVREALQVLSESGTQSGGTPNGNFEGAKHIMIGISQNGVPLSKSLNFRVTGDRWSTMNCIDIEASKATLLAALPGVEFQGEKAVPVAGDIVPLSWREYQAANDGMTQRQAKAAVAALKANPPTGTRMLAVSFEGGRGSATPYLVDAGISDEQAVAAIEQVSERKVKTVEKAWRSLR